MIEVQGLTKRYGETVAIDDVSFQVARGEVVGFLGPNGAGKSTTMRIIAGSLGASAGTARVGGFDVADDPRGVQAILGYAPEVPPVYTNMSVRDYVTFAATLKGVDDVSAATKKALGRVGLDKVAHRLIEHLSKGYRQRVGLAQALVHDPKVLVLDEPTSGLDPAQRVEIRNLLAELAGGDRTVVLSTHVLGEIEAICSRVIIINKGRIVAQDELSRLSAVGRAVKIELARPGAEALAALQAIPGVSNVTQIDERYVVHGDSDLREAVSRVAVPFGLLEMAGRERLEDIYLRLTTGGAS
ncbi:MAG: ATP-binding cassette domain-containing protein [Pseudomonadota bacterium]|nr:ATP-binding cassette domain-containing protein [Pseudomonadota bacterium]